MTRLGILVADLVEVGVQEALVSIAAHQKARHNRRTLKTRHLPIGYNTNDNSNNNNDKRESKAQYRTTQNGYGETKQQDTRPTQHQTKTT
eukprot:3260049-Rhodomonas_salina.1